MKLRVFIGFLFGLAVLAASLQPVYAQTFKYILVVILYEDGEAVRSRIYPMATQGECQTAENEMSEEAKKRELDVWVKCVSVDRPPEFRKQRDS